MLSKILTSLVVVFTVGCSNQESTSSLDAVPYQTGTLYVDPASHARIGGGILQYRLYEDGRIYYSGDLTYYATEGQEFEVQVPFSGKYRVAPAVLHSVTWREESAERLEKKVRIKADSAEAAESSLSLSVVDPEKVDAVDGKGLFRIGTSKDLLEILDVEVTGTVLGGIALRLHLSSTPFGIP